MPTDFYAAANVAKSMPAAEDMGMDYFNVRHMENARVKLQNFSKAWDVGSQLTAFYPFRLVAAKDDPTQSVWVPCMSAVWGHKVNQPKLLHRGFLRSRCAMSPNGDVLGAGDLAYQFSRMASLLVKAQKEQELAQCAARDWNVLGQSAYNTARQAIEDKYDPKKMNGIKPLLGRLTIQCSTVVYTVAMNSDTSTPMFDTTNDSKTKTGMFTHILSQERKDKLFNLANNALHGVRAQHPDKSYAPGDVEFLEVLYNFTSARMDKGEAGRADPQGVAQSISILARFPDAKKKVEDACKQVPTDPDDIRAKLYSMDPMRDEELMKALQQYTFGTSEAWGYLPPEDKERLVGSADVIDFLRIVPSDVELRKAFTDALGHEIGKAPMSAAPTIEGLVGDDTKFDVTAQGAAVKNVLQEAEQGQIPVEADPSGGFAEELEV